MNGGDLSLWLDEVEVYGDGYSYWGEPYSNPFWFLDRIGAQQGGKISITKSSDQAVINQYVRAMYDAQARNSSTINMAEYFTEYALSKKERNTAFAWSSYGRKVQGKLHLRDGGQPLDVFLIFNLDEDWSIMPLKPNSPHQNSGTDSKGFFFFYNYYFEGTPNYNALIFKAYLPNKAADDRFHGFIWNRK